MEEFCVIEVRYMPPGHEVGDITIALAVRPYEGWTRVVGCSVPHKNGQGRRIKGGWKATVEEAEAEART